MRGENGSLDPDWKHCLALNSFELYGCLKRRISRRIYDFDPNSR